MRKHHLNSFQQNSVKFMPCLVCGVDSKPVIFTFVFTVFGVLLASLIVLLWANAKGKFANTETNASLAINAESVNPEKEDNLWNQKNEKSII